MSYKVVACSTSRNVCFLWCCTTVYSYKHTMQFDKSPDILLSVQGKHNLPLRGRCTNPLEKTSWGLRKKKGGQYRPEDRG